MNYLAHLFLSGDDPDIAAGNFMGDAIKGKRYLNYPKKVSHGIMLHRHIDTFTDNHPLTHDANVLVRPFIGRYAPVATDMFYDHLLAKNWKTYNKIDLLAYTENMYELLEKYKPLFPPNVARMYTYMKRDNWLFAYQSKEGLDTAIKGLSRRIGKENQLYRGLECLEEHYEQLDEIFSKFFPELISFVASWKYSGLAM